MPGKVTYKSTHSCAGLFISYTRSDGITFAKDLRCRLIDEYHFKVWQDIVELEGGKDWWLQIEAAIKSVEFLVKEQSMLEAVAWKSRSWVCLLPTALEFLSPFVFKSLTKPCAFHGRVLYYKIYF